MSETPRKPGERPEDEIEATGGEQETADQPTVSLNPDEEPTKPLLEDEPAEYELPDPAPRRADSAAEGPSTDETEAESDALKSGPTDAGGAKPGFEPRPGDRGLPTSDPVFPTASPQLKPPTGAPGSAAGAGAPAVAESSPAGVGRPMPPQPPRQRSAAEIRADIEAGRQELSQSVEVLRDKVEELTDWRGQIRKHRREITIAAAAVGFVVGARFMMKRRRR